MKKKPTIDTQLIHAGERRERIGGAVVLPIFQSSTYLYGGEERYEDVRYIRLNNSPNHRVLGEKLALLESAEAGLVTGSGMAAISAALLSRLDSGSHLLAQQGLYGGTHDFIVDDLPRLGINHDLIDASSPGTWTERLKPSTRVIYVESISNPLMSVGDLEAVVAFAREHGLTSIIDNTFATPVNFRPAELGFDLVVHSGSKYLNGHTDIVAGAVVGRRSLVEEVNRRLLHLGGTLDPHACFLLQRGLKTLALRVRHQNESACRIADFLASRPEIAAVNYPGLTGSPSFERASRLFSGCGGMLSFEPAGGVEAATAITEHLELGVEAPSLGGPETLVTRPSTTSHVGIPAAERQQLGISDELVRVSVGIEGTADLIADFDQALSFVPEVAV